MAFNRSKVFSVAYLFYEIIGCCFLTMAFMLDQKTMYPYVAFVVSLWAWKHGGAHFNTAITVGDLVYNSDSMGSFLA
jgi:hypothetical protein